MAEQLGITGKTGTGRYNLNYTGDQLAGLLEILNSIQDLEASEFDGVVTIKLRGAEYRLVGADVYNQLQSDIEKLRYTVRYKGVDE